MSKIEVNTVEPQCGTTLTLGESGDTVTLGCGLVKQVLEEQEQLIGRLEILKQEILQRLLVKGIL
jgi:hypothetical protein